MILSPYCCGEDGESELTTIQMFWESVFVVLLWVQTSSAVGFKFRKDLVFYAPSSKP